jgi:AraC-like DNA-binding protein
MQFESHAGELDTMAFRPEQPVSPYGRLFTYVPSDRPAFLHYHNFFELGYCEGGSGVFIIDGEILPFDGRCCSIITEGQVHIAQSLDPPKSLWHFLYLDLPTLFLDGTRDQVPYRKPDYLHYDYPNLIPYADDAEMYDLVRLILLEAARADDASLSILRNLVSALLLRHGRTRIGAALPAKKPRLPEIGQVINYISTQYAQDLDIDALASVANLSRASLQRKFAAVTGQSPMQYLHRMRLNFAALMLRNEARSVSEIAMDVGYNSLSSFNRLFVRAYGMSPSQWRKQFQKK